MERGRRRKRSTATVVMTDTFSIVIVWYYNYFHSQLSTTISSLPPQQLLLSPLPYLQWPPVHRFLRSSAASAWLEIVYGKSGDCSSHSWIFEIVFWLIFLSFVQGNEHKQKKNNPASENNLKSLYLEAALSSYSSCYWSKPSNITPKHFLKRNKFEWVLF